MTEQSTASSLWELHSFGCQWSQQPNGSSLWKLCSSSYQWASSQLAVLAANLLGSSAEKLWNPCLLTLHAARPIPLENCTNLIVRPLLIIHSRKCTNHACLALLQPKLSLPKFAQFCIPTEPPLANNHYRLRLFVSISQLLLQFASAVAQSHHLTSQPYYLSRPPSFEWSCFMVD